MLAGYDSHLLWYMQIFKGLIHKAKAATDSLAWNLLYVRKSLKDYYLCPKSPLLTSPAVSVLPTSPRGSRALPTLPLGSGAGVGAHHAVPAPLLPGTCWPHGQLHRDALLPPCFLSEQTAAPRSHFSQSKPELLLLGRRWWYFCVDLKPEIPIWWTMVSNGAIKYNFNNI